MKTLKISLIFQTCNLISTNPLLLLGSEKSILKEQLSELSQNFCWLLNEEKFGKWRAIFTLEDVKKFQKTNIYIVTHQLKKRNLC